MAVCKNALLLACVYCDNLTIIHTDVRGQYNSTPLHYACLGGKKEIVQYLVEKLKCDIGESLRVVVFVCTCIQCRSHCNFDYRLLL